MTIFILLCYLLLLWVGESETIRRHLQDTKHDANMIHRMEKHDFYNRPEGNDIQRDTNSCGGKQVDILFAVDSSSSVSQSDFRRQLDLISTLSNILTFEGDQTRAGVVTYGSDTITDMRLGAYKNRTAFKNGLLLTPGLAGERDVGQLLEFVENKVFRTRFSRRSVAHVLILLTTGRTERFSFALKNAAISKKAGRYIYILDSGSELIDDEYYQLASFPASSFVFDNDPYGLQSSLSSVLAMVPCDLSIDQPVYLPKNAECRIKRPVDIVFAVDHLSAGKANTEILFQFIRQFLSDIWDPKHLVRVGIAAPRSPSIRASYRNLMIAGRLSSELMDVRFPRYSDLLKKTRKMLLRGRPTVNKIAVMFVDESVLIDKTVLAEAEKNKGNKIETYVVSFGTHVDELSLGMISTGRNNGYLIRLTSYSQLPNQQTDLDAMICRGL